MTDLWLLGHVLDQLDGLPDGSAHTSVTSPPYFWLRDYDTEPQEWPEVTFAPMPGLPPITIPATRCCLGNEPDPWAYVGHLVLVFRGVRRVLRDDGTLWLNLGEVASDNTPDDHARAFSRRRADAPTASQRPAAPADAEAKTTRNRRSVWTIAPQPFACAHFATFPPALAEPCILAGSPRGGVVLDPFGGAGTTALVARRNGRRFVHIELNPDYLAIARKRVDGEGFQAPLFATGAA